MEQMKGQIGEIKSKFNFVPKHTQPEEVQGDKSLNEIEDLSSEQKLSS
jgi:hypothetical protein